MKTEVTGAQAASIAMKHLNPDVVSAFPITPQTDIMMEFGQYVADGEVSTDLILVESEHSAMSAAVGASAAGVRAMTATSSAGLALMFEILGVASGSRLPIIMNVVNRALSSPINIHCDHSDSMDCRDIGWIQLYSENAQEVYDNTIIGTKLAESVKLPVMVMQDGFINSHCLQNIELLEDKKVNEFAGELKPVNSLLDFKKPVTIGPLQLTDYYFETKRQQSEALSDAYKDYIKFCREFAKISGRSYDYVEEYKLKDAKHIIVALNSTCGAVKDVVDELRNRGEKVGLLKIRMFRPFPYERVFNALKKCKSVTVLDRSESFGANPPLMSEVKNSLSSAHVIINSVIYGLGGREFTEEDVKLIFNNMIKGKKVKHYAGCRE
ncbi:MAG: pyruvate ferredoxin oxidoreductase [Nanoarchaeota archaeon]|nr:pyruvate ferredoxin oxidoreductase [Nanoarchaeota archaeon]